MLFLFVAIHKSHLSQILLNASLIKISERSLPQKSINSKFPTSVMSLWLFSIPIHLPIGLCNEFNSVIHGQNRRATNGKINHHRGLFNILNSVKRKKTLCLRDFPPLKQKTELINISNCLCSILIMSITKFLNLNLCKTADIYW